MLQQVDLHSNIDLAGMQTTARGRRRAIYFLGGHDFPMVLKVPNYQWEAQTAKPLKRFRQWLLPRGKYRVLAMEADYSMKRQLDAASSARTLPLPRFHGYVQTSLGAGAIWEAICDESGNLGRTLREICDAGEIEQALEPLNATVARLFALNIVAPDLNGRNLVLSPGPKPRFFLVDGFGDPNLIPVRSLLRPLNRKRLLASCERLAEKCGLVWDPRSLTFGLAQSPEPD